MGSAGQDGKPCPCSRIEHVLSHGGRRRGRRRSISRDPVARMHATPPPSPLSPSANTPPRASGKQRPRGCRQRCASTGSVPNLAWASRSQFRTRRGSGAGQGFAGGEPRSGAQGAGAPEAALTHAPGRAAQGTRTESPLSRPLRVLTHPARRYRGSLCSALTRARTPWVRLAKTGSPAPVLVRTCACARWGASFRPHATPTGWSGGALAAVVAMAQRGGEGRFCAHSTSASRGVGQFGIYAAGQVEGHPRRDAPCIRMQRRKFPKKPENRGYPRFRGRRIPAHPHRRRADPGAITHTTGFSPPPNGSGPGPRGPRRPGSPARCVRAAGRCAAR